MGYAVCPLLLAIEIKVVGLTGADPECCDGSDEWGTGACPSRCSQIGKEYREKAEAEMKTRKTVSHPGGQLRKIVRAELVKCCGMLTGKQGAKIRSTYVKWALGEKKRLEGELERKTGEVKGKEVELELARGEFTCRPPSEPRSRALGSSLIRQFSQP
jgi:hypothetical protein